jgi:DNA topoisomerase-1
MGIKISNFPIRWSTSLAWVLGYYYGDGSYSNPKYNGSHQIYFTTTEKKSLELLKENIKTIFGNEPYAYDLGGKYKVNCNCAVATILIKIFPNLEGKEPISIPKSFIGDFLRGFFDADGNVHLRPLGKTIIKGKECNSYNTPRVKITLARKDLVEWISTLLKELNIENNINKNTSTCKGKKFDCWTILISGIDRIEKYTYKIGFDSYKEEILYKGLTCGSQKYKVLKNCALIYSKLIKQEMKPEDIAFNLNIKRFEVMKSLRHLLSLNLINRKRIGNRKLQKWFYFISKKNADYERFCIKILYNKIEKNIYELPIKKISKIIYKGDVYDLSIDKESPNFITAGNILIHNSTRANIIETLYDRGYITDNKSIQATPLGIDLIDTLKKYSPIIIDEKLTRNMEKDMESIGILKKDLDKKQSLILEKARFVLKDISEDFKKKELQIGKELIHAEEENWKKENERNELTECQVCKKGKMIIKYSPKNRKHFVACTNYPECKSTFSLPPFGLIKSINKPCDKCSFPLLMSLRKGKRPWIFCFNPNCESRQQNSVEQAQDTEEAKVQDNREEGEEK